MNATSRAKLVRLCEGVKLVVQDRRLSGREENARDMQQPFPGTYDVKIPEEWRDFLVSLQPFRSQRIERLRASAEITLS